MNGRSSCNAPDSSLIAGAAGLAKSDGCNVVKPRTLMVAA